MFYKLPHSVVKTTGTTKVCKTPATENGHVGKIRRA